MQPKIKVERVCVVGGGQMGRQIALNTAIYGYQVNLTDILESTRESVRTWGDEYLQNRIAKGRMTYEQVQDINEHFNIADSLEKASENADLVIEAIVEQEEEKHRLFKRLNNIIREDTILATNSSCMVSSLFINDIKNPSRLINLHYFNPALVMRLTEVMQGEHCSDETALAALDFCRSTGKEPIWLHKEIERLLLNRIFKAIYDEVYLLVENGYCNYEDVDKACELGAGHPMGPFKLRDLTGIDMGFCSMQEEYKRTGIKPPGFDLLEQKVKEGRYGKKSGHGFYDYE